LTICMTISLWSKDRCLPSFRLDNLSKPSFSSEDIVNTDITLCVSEVQVLHSSIQWNLVICYQLFIKIIIRFLMANRWITWFINSDSVPKKNTSLC
jgi:hypothetical protein